MKLNPRSTTAVLTLICLLVTFAAATSKTSGATVAPAIVATSAITPDASSPDLTHLPLGDGKLSSHPQIGWIWACHVEPSSGAGSFVNGPWFNADGKTYNLLTKAVVNGSVTWPQHNFTITIEGDQRILTTNDLPDHPTGIYPIAATDKAFQYDRNPNKIAAQTMRITLSANPTLAAQPTCAPGAVGMLLTGVPLFSALDAPGRDAVAHEVQDACQGHPQKSSTYHYHSLTTCLPDTTTGDGHSALVGYALDGFGIFGRRDVGGKILSSADLDACHGHTHEIEWDGKKVVMYHYHATWDFPYTVGCMSGSYADANIQIISGSPEGANAGANGLPQTPPAGNGPPPGGPDLAAAAKKLGITEQALRDALGPPPPNLAAAAQKLGITEQALREALGIP